MSEVMQVLMGVGIVSLLAVLVFVVGWLIVAIKRLESAFVQIDRALVPFGQSGLGRLANTAAIQARGYFDQATDPAVIQLAALLGSVTFAARWAKAAGIEITPERIAVCGRALFDTLGNLTDGVPAEQVSQATKAEGIPIPQRETFDPGSGTGL